MSDSAIRTGPDWVKLEALAWCVFIGSAFALSLDFDAPLRHYPPGAALWPRIILFFMMVAAVVLFVSRFLPQTIRLESEQNPEYLDDVPNDLAGVGWRTAMVFILPMLWAFAMHQLGFLLVTPLFLIAFTWLMGVRSWRTLLLFSCGFYALLVLLFYKLIYTPLPMGAGVFHTINGELLALIQ
jgi:hypothetical protein